MPKIFFIYEAVVEGILSSYGVHFLPDRALYLMIYYDNNRDECISTVDRSERQ